MFMVVFIAYFLYFIICANISDSINVAQQSSNNPTTGCVLPPHPRNGRWSLLGGIKNPGDIVLPSSVLEFQCDNSYKLSKNKNVICIDGWIPQEMPECEVSEQCGMKVNGSSSENYNIEGELVKHIDYPWIVIIYKGTSYIGHGNIISRKLIITGARVLTVWNVWTLLNPDEITVGTGKYYKFSGDPREPDAKYYKAENIYISEGFKGISEGVSEDIGFVVVKTPIQYDKWTQPICIEGVDDIVVRGGDILEIVGWVSTDNIAVATPLTNEIIIKKLSQCLLESPPLGDYLSPDAICAGPVDNSTCIGHSGSGLVYKNPKNDRYYLAAMYSFGVKSCVGKNNLYISIKYHYNYVLEQIKKYN